MAQCRDDSGGDDTAGVDAMRGLDDEGLAGELADNVEQLDATLIGGLIELAPRSFALRTFLRRAFAWSGQGQVGGYRGGEVR